MIFHCIPCRFCVSRMLSLALNNLVSFSRILHPAVQELDSEFVVKLFEARQKPVLRCFLSKLLCIGVEFNPSGSLFLRFFVHHISSCWFSSWWKMTWESCELSKTKMEQGFHYLGFIASITTVWVDLALCHHCTQVHEICSGSLVTAGEPKGYLSNTQSVKPCGYPTSCHDALRWPKERYQEPVLAAGERTGCVPCNLATQICPSSMGDIQAQSAGEYSIIFWY